MIRTEAAFVDRQGAAQQWFGFCQAIRGVKQLCQAAQSSCDPGMIRPEAPFITREGATN
jgi:hypothetical protein